MPESSEWVRVTQTETGAHLSVHRSVADDSGFRVLKDQSGAVDYNDRPAPPDYPDSKSSNKTANQATTEKES